MLAEKLGDDLEERFGIEIAAHLAVQPDRGAGIDEVGNLHDMLALPFWISGDVTSIFQIELDLLPWLSQFEGPGLAATMLFNTARLA